MTNYNEIASELAPDGPRHDEVAEKIAAALQAVAGEKDADRVQLMKESDAQVALFRNALERSCGEEGEGVKR